MSYVGTEPPKGGVVVQEVFYETGAIATGTTIMPNDDTIPQNTEGNQYMQLSITPTDANNYLDIYVVWNGSNSSVNQRGQVALFEGNKTNAIASAFTPYDGNIPQGTGCTAFSHRVLAGSTIGKTFKVRAGYPNAGTTTFNGFNGTRVAGGVMASSIRIREVSPNVIMPTGEIIGPTTFPRGHISGLVLSNNVIDPLKDVDISVGKCRSTDDTTNFELTSAQTKQLDASWASGTNAGGLSSSLTLTASTWYHAFAMTVGGTPEIGFDSSVTGANLVADHSATIIKRIGSVYMDSSTNVLTFTAVEKSGGEVHVIWDASYSISINNSTTAANFAAGAPVGYRTLVYVDIRGSESASGTTKHLRVYSPDANDEAVSASNSTLTVRGTSGGTTNHNNTSIVRMTNTNGELRSRVSSVFISLSARTLAYDDFRSD